MKKIILFAIGILTSVIASADDISYPYKGVTMTYELSGSSATLKLGPTTSATEVEIPSSISENNESYNVIAIAKDAFKNNKYITEVILGDKVETIGESAFYGCDQLKKIKFPASLGTIGSNAFNGCSRLAHIGCEVDDPKNLRPDALPQNTSNNMVTLYVNEGKKTAYAEHELWGPKFGNRIFEGEMRTVSYKGMWYVCASVSKEATLYIGKNETEIEIPEPDELIDKNIHYRVTGIDRSAFYGYSNIRRLTISSDVRTIGSNAFANCTNLSHVYCKVANPANLNPERLPSNEMMTLYVSTDEIKAAYDAEEETEGRVAWKNKFKNRIYVGGMSMVSNDGMWYVCANDGTKPVATLYSGKDEADIVIPGMLTNNSIVTGIDKIAFSGLSKIVSLTIPETVTAIGPEAFRNCNNLVYVYSKIKAPYSINNNVFSNKAKAILYTPANATDTYTNKTGWNFGSSKVCEDMEVFLYNGMSFVGWVLGGDKNAILIKGVAGAYDVPFNVPNKVSSPQTIDYDVIAIGDNAFNGIGLFKNLTIPSNIKSIGSNTFRSCGALETVDLQSTQMDLGTNAFYDCKKLKDINLDVVKTIGASAFQNCTGLKIVTLSSILQSLGDKAFYGCSNLAEVINNSSIDYKENAFPDDNVILYVPDDKSSYIQKGWTDSKFLHIFQGERKVYNDDINKVDYVYTNNDTEAVLLSSNVDNDNETIDISDEINTTKRVTAIAKSAFMDNIKLKVVTFSSNLIKIGKSAFKNCTSLNNISLPTSLHVIGEYAFENNTSLTSIVIPNNTTTIRQYAFRKCSNLNTLTLPASLIVIEDYAFDQCVGLTTINSKIPGASDMPELKEHVFSPYIVPTIYVESGIDNYKTHSCWARFKNYYRTGQKETREITGEVNMTYEYYTGGDEATLIIGNAKDNKIVIPDAVTIDTKSYKVTAIGDDAFQNTQNKANVNSLTIGENVATIGANAFKDFKGLTSVTLPSKVTAISKSAFEGCSNLETVSFTKDAENKINISTIGAYAFKGCSKLKMGLPENLTSIGNNAFEGNTSLISLSIPNGVTSIGASAFKGCTNLESVTFLETNESPASLKAIGDYAFSGCNHSKFSRLDIPEGTETIGMYAFEKCTNLATVTLPSTLNKIDVYAFKDCSNLLTIISKIDKDHLFEIDETVFPITVYLTAELFVPIYIDSDPEAIPNPELSTENEYKKVKGWNQFYHFVDGEKKEETIGCLKYEYLTGKKLATVIGMTIPDDEKLLISEKVTIGTDDYTITAIGDNAFDALKNPNTVNIKKIKISAKITNIGVGAFYGCTGLTEIELPSSLETIGSSAFYGCTGLTDIYFPSTLKKIATNAFYGCSNILKVELPADLNTLEASAFSQCTNLRKVWLPEMLENIGSGVFYNCSRITNVCSDIANPPTITDNVFEYINSTATLFVPKGCESNYNKSGWNKFSNVVAGKFVGDYKATTGDEKDMTFSCYTIDDENAAILTKGETTNVKVIIPETVNPGSAIEGGPFTVRIVGKNAFLNRSNIKMVQLPTNLTAIGDNAFAGCNNLTEVESKIQTPFDIIAKSNKFPESAVSLYIPQGEGIKDAYLAAHWDGFDINIGRRIEETRNKITYLYAEYGETATILKSENSNDNPIIPRTVPETDDKVKVTAIADGAFSGNTKLEYVELPENLITIGANAFLNCTGLRYVTLPSTLTAIGNDAFKGCTKLTDINSKIENPFDISNKGTIFPDNAVSLFIPHGDGIEAGYRSKNWGDFVIYDGVRIEKTIDNLTYVYAEYGTTATIIKSNTTNNNPKISASVPETNDNVKVTTIAESAFENNKSLPSVDIPENVTKIGANAFKGCTGIKYVTLPATLEVIGNGAFSDCPKLTDIDSRRSDNLIDLTSRKDVVFPVSAVSLYVPQNKEQVYSDAGWSFVTIHNGNRIEKPIGNITYLYAEYESYASIIKGETEIADLKIPATVPDITIPNTTDKVNIKSIAESAFSGNTKLESLKLPEGLETIGANAFKGCANLKKVWLPANLTVIGDNAFSGCNNIAYVCTQASSPVGILANVFSTDKATLFVPDETAINSYENNDVWNNLFPIKRAGLFVDTYNKDNITYECAVKGSGEAAKPIAILKKTATTTSEVVIPESVGLDNDQTQYSVTSIAESAFSGNTKLVSLTIPSTIASIGDEAFGGCSNLSIITCTMVKPVNIKNRNVFSDYSATLYIPVNSTVKDYADNGWNFSNIYVGERKEDTIAGFTYVYSTGDKKAVVTKVSLSDKDISIPGEFTIDGITYKVIEIAKSLFKGNKNIVNLTINKNIETIGAGAFQGCVNLKKIILPSTLKVIGNNAFDGCESIGYICSKGDEPATIGSNSFPSVIATTAKLCVPGNAISVYKQTNGWNYTNTYEGELEELSIGNLNYYCVKGQNVAFLVKASISDPEITIDAKANEYDVIEIDDYAFSGISLLEKVSISNGIIRIGTGAFQNCSKLKEVEISASIVAIGDYAFDRCGSLSLVRSNIETPCDLTNKTNVFTVGQAKLRIPEGNGIKDSYIKKGWNNYFSTILEGDVDIYTTADGNKYQYVTGNKTATLLKATPKEKEWTIPSIITIDDSNYEIKAIEKGAVASSTIENLTISEGITSIGVDAFKSCGNITKLSLPSSLETIGDNAFANSSKLMYIQSAMTAPIAISENVFHETVYQNATLFIPIGATAKYVGDSGAVGWKKFSKDKVLEGTMIDLTKDGMTYICVSNLGIAKLIKGKNSKEVKIPSKVTDNGITYKVVDIDVRAFSGLGSLEKIVIPENVETIGMEAFKNCQKLKSMELPATLKSITANAFSGCSQLILITCAGNEPAEISDSSFPANKITINVPVGAKDAYLKAEYWKDYNIVASISSVSDDEDESTDPVTYVNTSTSENEATVAITDGTEVFGSFAIPELVGLDGTYYTVTAIAAGTFEDNKNLTDVVIPNTVVSIGESAFAGCTNLKSITVNWVTPLKFSAPATTRGYLTRSADSSIFDGVNKSTCILYVPAGCETAYREAAVWREFKNILPIGATAINGIVVSDDGIPFDVYNMQGRKVRDSVTSFDGLPSGVYIVNGQKVMVK